ncbi:MULTISPECIES: hypothetical protein [Methanobacteriota]|uniref:Uncharacterized protein n=6 Tax=Methanosarcina mazei TaxID=2209 RepID=A0A0F8FGM1_METMZ|nr:hypothetical protein [Methanosarcina mazei]AKB69393.1 hypothetical protein MSMAL_2850 [Methanosarcina mazei LYC]AKB72089.1 hypothetical protein MSMAC_2199 [Methanosarcina mazei C16]KKF99532.1 hypothetical protein DU40_00820 [Methanosarcina mazei]KKG02405.1 hypothetical protein DU31_04925 [Methanosarcina mazei]KKG02828.1 hypothetical protein DU47_00900 [Methanosarcina mazei]
MKLNSKVRKISGLFMIMLVVGMILVTPAMACPAGTNCENNSISGDSIQLKGEDKEKLVNMALKDTKVKEFQEQLTKEGFIQKDSEALIIPVKNEKDGSTKEISFVAIPFQHKESQELKNIIYTYNPQTEESAVVLVEGGLSDCIYNLAICLGSFSGCAIVCGPLLVPDPAEPIEAELCLSCIPIAFGSCGLAYNACYDYYFGDE